MNTNKQTPSRTENWLYQDFSDDNRCFTKIVYRAAGTAPWPECTDDDKTAWERAHQPEEPERDAATNQIEDVEVVQ